jgi:hypothetical protein
LRPLDVGNKPWAVAKVKSAAGRPPVIVSRDQNVRLITLSHGTIMAISVDPGSGAKGLADLRPQGQCDALEL